MPGGGSRRIAPVLSLVVATMLGLVPGFSSVAAAAVEAAGSGAGGSVAAASVATASLEAAGSVAGGPAGAGSVVGVAEGGDPTSTTPRQLPRTGLEAEELDQGADGGAGWMAASAVAAGVLVLGGGLVLRRRMADEDPAP